MSLLQFCNGNYGWTRWETWLYGAGCSLFGYWLAQ